MKTDIEIDASLLEKISNSVDKMKFSVFVPAFKVAAEPIEQRATNLAKSSIVTGTRKKWGSNKTDKFDPELMRKHSSGKHIAHKVLTRSDIGPLMIIGPKYRDGNKQQFNNSPDGREVFVWGRRPKSIPTHRERDKPFFMEQASVEVGSVAIDRFVSELEKKMEAFFNGI